MGQKSRRLADSALLVRSKAGRVRGCIKCKRDICLAWQACSHCEPQVDYPCFSKRRVKPPPSEAQLRPVVQKSYLLKIRAKPLPAYKTQCTSFKVGAETRPAVPYPQPVSQNVQVTRGLGQQKVSFHSKIKISRKPDQAKVMK